MKKVLLYLLVGMQTCFATPTKDQIETFVQDQNQFSLNLYHSLNDHQNLIYSPFSIFSCLSMIYVGARETTATEIQKALSLGFSPNKVSALADETNRSLWSKPEENPTYDLSLANGLWVNKDSFVLSDYRHALQDDFEAQVSEIDFAKTDEALQIINEWTSNTTHGKIPELLQKGDIDLSTRLVITNALYFKGSWELPFHPDQTQEAPFYLAPNEATPVSMMDQTATIPYFENDLLQMIALSFQGKTIKNSHLACLFLLPKEGVPFSEVETALTSTNFTSWIKGLYPAFTKVKIPRFELRKRFHLNQTLQNMGMKIAFTDQANLSGIDGMKDLMVNHVIHEAYFHLDESGVTASAATAGSIGLTSFPDKNLRRFTANRPFLFAIIDMNSHLPLFMGQLIQPKKI